MTDTTPIQRRPGGRSAQVQASVCKALEELVAEQGREKVTVPAVAERAGVSASSIYRRWGDLPGLLAETATRRLDPQRPLPDTGDLRADLTAWARELIVHLGQPHSTALMKAAAALAGDTDADCLCNRRAEAGQLIATSRARGDTTPEPRQVIDHVVAPIVFRLIFGAEPVPPAFAELLVDELFAIAGTAPPRARATPVA